MTDDGLFVQLAFVEKDLSVIKRQLSETLDDKTLLLELFKTKTQEINKLREALKERGYIQL